MTLATIEAALGTIPSDMELIALARELGALPRRQYPGLSPRWESRTIAGSEQDQTTPPAVENPLWEIVRHMPGRRARWPTSGTIEPNGYWAGGLDGSGLRRAYAAGLGGTELCARYSWSIPSPGDMRWLAKILDGQGVVEIGAGSGYWAWQMTQAGIDTVAYDPQPPGPENTFNQHRLYHDVQPGDHERAADHPDRALMLCWPSHGAAFAKQALHAYCGDTVVYIGESEGGYCADDRFHRILRRDFDEIGTSPFHVTYWGIHCEMTAYRRRPASRRDGEES